jgi:hypothetical protein
MRLNFEECIVFLTRPMCVLLGMFLLLSSADASAGDFTVAYAFDAGDVNDAGKTTTCEYKTFCRIESDKLKLWISLSFWNSDHKEVDVQVSGNKGRPACCFFFDGVDSVRRNARQSLIRLHVFEGRRRIRNEFIQNAPLGVLYLQFSDMK